MAHLCTIASVPDHLVREIRNPADLLRVASKFAYASHYIAASAPEIKQAIDGGTPLDTDTWHPVRGFMLNDPAAVFDHTQRLKRLIEEMATPTHRLHKDDFIHTELAKVVVLFRHASLTGESIVTCLDLNRTKRRKA